MSKKKANGLTAFQVAGDNDLPDDEFQRKYNKPDLAVPRKKITIDIKGTVACGKSTVLLIIEEALSKAGFPVTLNEEARVAKNSSYPVTAKDKQSLRALNKKEPTTIFLNEICTRRTPARRK